ncbi:BEACH domain-containing protein lvsF [Diplonema papillatum]|nr:BEACH domain-containing protein lvsF [Diplonema papillatum]
MPWVLADYTSSELDLSNPLTFRDLSKPVGALNPHRLDSFRQRMEETKSLGDEASAYLYATHYSNPSYVLYYLLRQHPEWMLLIHKGKFDKGDRLFNSVAACWNNVLNLPNDVKELIPQFYNGDGSWLGSKGLELGLLDDGTKVPDNVVLPPWATSMADFVKKNREALESEHVSANLHGWIDLIFGHASRGEPAVDHDNVFHPLTYGQSAEPMSPAESEQVREFGQCPIQLFGKRHPSRRVTTAAPAYAELSAALQPRTDYCEDDDSAYPDNADDFKLITMGSSYVLEDLPSADAAIEDISALGIGGNLSFNSPPPRIDSSLVVHEEASVNLPAESSLLEPMRFRAVLEARCMKKSASGVTTASFDTVPEWLAKCMQLAFEEDMIGTGVTFDASHLDAAFVTGESGQLPVMDLTNGTRLRTLQLGSQKLTSVAVVPRDPTVLFVGSQDNHVYCYNLADGKLEDRIQAHEASVTAMRLHSDGVRLATGGEDGSVKIWKVEDFGLRISDSFNEHQSQVSAVAWCNDATWLASCGDDSVLVYDTKCPQAGVLFRADVEDCLQVQFVDNSPTVVVMTSQAVQVMDLRTNTVMWQQAEQNPFVPGTLYWGPATTWAASTSRLLGFDSSNGALVTKHSVAAGSTVQGLALLATDALPKFVLVAQAASKYTTTAVLSSATGSY